MPFLCLASYLTAFERCTGRVHPRAWLGVQGEPDLDAVTVGQVLEGVDEAAQAAGCARHQVLTAVEHEIMQARIHEVLRESDDRRRMGIERTDALVLNEADFAGHERRVNFLDKEHERLLKQLELSQRARGGALPPPIRLQRSEDSREMT